MRVDDPAIDAMVPESYQTITVTTQDELDAALAAHKDDRQATILIDSPQGVWLHLRGSVMASVMASGSATVWAHDSATVMAYGSATVWASGSASVWAFDSASVTAFGSATVRAFDDPAIDAMVPESDVAAWAELGAADEYDFRHVAGGD